MRARWIVALVFAGVLLMLGVVGLSARPAFRSAHEGVRLMRAGAKSTFGGDADRAAQWFREARASFQRASSTLDTFVPDVVAKLPVAGSWMRTAREIAEGGTIVAEAGEKLTATWTEVQPAFRRPGGGFDLDVLREGAAGLESVQALLARAAETVQPGSPPLTALTTRYHEEVVDVRRQVDVGVHALQLASVMFAGDRSYFVAMQTPSELRGTGGLIGAYGVLDVQDGRARMVRVGRPREDLPTPQDVGVTAPDWYQARYGRFEPLDIWPNINMTPDFPTTAKLIADASARIEKVGPVDGVVAIDPVALSALLRLTGPVRVPSWDEPIGADNVVEILGRTTYERYPEGDPRIDFVTEAVQATFNRLFSAPITPKSATLEPLGAAFAGRHFQIWSAHPEQQERLRSLGTTGDLAPGEADVFSLVSQNASGTKGDFFLRREVTYGIDVQPSGDAVVRVTTVLKNGLPGSGLPKYMIGPYIPGDEPGWTRNWLNVYGPPGTALLSVSVGGERRTAEVAAEAGLSVFSTYVKVAPRSQETFTATLLARRLVKSGRLSLVFRTQPLLFADKLTIRLRDPGRRFSVEGAEWTRDYWVWEVAHDRDLTVRALIKT